MLKAHPDWNNVNYVNVQSISSFHLYLNSRFSLDIQITSLYARSISLLCFEYDPLINYLITILLLLFLSLEMRWGYSKLRNIKSKNNNNNNNLFQACTFESDVFKVL